MAGDSAGTQSAPYKFGIFTHLKSIHFSQSGSFVQTIDFSLAGRAMFELVNGEPPMNMYLMAGDNLLKPTVWSLLGVATGFNVPININGALVGRPATDNFWMGLVGGNGDSPQIFDGTFVCTLHTEQTINGKQTTSSQTFKFTTPNDLPCYSPGQTGQTKCLGWLADGGSGGPLSNSATFVGSAGHGSVPFYVTYPLVPDFTAKQVLSAAGTRYSESQYQGPG